MRLLDDLNNLINILKSYFEAKKDVFSGLGLGKVKLTSPPDDFLAVFDEFLEKFLEIKKLGLAVNKSQIVNAEIDLKRCMSKKMVQNS